MRKRTSFVPASNSAWSRSVGSVFVPAMPPGLETMLSDPGRYAVFAGIASLMRES